MQLCTSASHAGFYLLGLAIGVALLVTVAKLLLYYRSIILIESEHASCAQIIGKASEKANQRAAEKPEEYNQLHENISAALFVLVRRIDENRPLVTRKRRCGCCTHVSTLKPAELMSAVREAIGQAMALAKTKASPTATFGIHCALAPFCSDLSLRQPGLPFAVTLRYITSSF